MQCQIYFCLFCFLIVYKLLSGKQILNLPASNFGAIQHLYNAAELASSSHASTLGFLSFLFTKDDTS